MKKKVILGVIIALVLIAVIVAAIFIFGGKTGKNNPIVGTWEGSSDGTMQTTLTFEENGNATYLNQFGVKGTGTYEIKDDQITILLDIWQKIYKFEVKDGKLDLTATDAYSPSYKGMVKK